MAVVEGSIAASATLTGTVSDTVSLSGGPAGALSITNRDGSETLWVRFAVANEIQTLTLTAGDESDTFDLTQGGNESTTAVTIPAGGFGSVTASQIQTTLESMNSHTSATIKASATSTAGVFEIEFIGTAGNKDQGAITVTSTTGNAAGSVTETRKGLGAVADADENFAILPQAAMVVEPFYGREFSVVGSGNEYSVAVH